MTLWGLRESRGLRDTVGAPGSQSLLTLVSIYTEAKQGSLSLCIQNIPVSMAGCSCSQWCCVFPLLPGGIASYKRHSEHSGTRHHRAGPPSGWQQRHLSLHQNAQSPVQCGLECFQARGIHQLAGKSVPVFHQSASRIFPYLCSEPTLFQLKTISPCPLDTGPTETFLHMFPRRCFEV